MTDKYRELIKACSVAVAARGGYGPMLTEDEWRDVSILAKARFITPFVMAERLAEEYNSDSSISDSKRR